MICGFQKSHIISSPVHLFATTFVALLLWNFSHVSSEALALTIKSDGTWVQKSGEVTQDSYASRFKEQMKSFSRDWKHSSGMDKELKGYFGDDILLPGTPLLRISGIKKGEDYLEAVLRLNGFSSVKSLNRYIIANATAEFLEEAEIEEKDLQIYLETAWLDQVGDTGAKFAKLKSLTASISPNFAASIGDNIEGKVSEEIEKQIERQVSEKVEKQIEESVGDWLQDLIDRYNIDPSTIIEVGDGWVTTCSGPGC